MASSHKAKINKFMDITGSTKADAETCLKDADWNIELAVDGFFSKSTIFDTYKDDDNIIGPEGTEKLCADLGLDPSDVVTIVLSWHMKCPAMCEFTRKGFQDGCKELNVETLEDLKNSIPRMRDELKDPITGKQIYLFTFNIARLENQKNLGLETAIAFWDLLMSERFEHMDLWKQFLVEKHGKAISKDTWNLFWDFAANSAKDYSDHDDNGAWPVLIDNFVEWVKPQLSK